MTYFHYIIERNEWLWGKKMKITDVVYKDYVEVKKIKGFNVKRMPEKPRWYLQILTWLLSFPETFAVRSDIRKYNMNGVEGPYIMLCNHNSFVDFKVATRAVFPRRSNYVVAVDGFIGRENLMFKVGCFMKRKFVSDPVIVRQIRHSLSKNKVICQIYPEARYSLVGTNSILPDSLGKLVKMMNVPVVTLISHGHHLRQPFWNLKKRRVKTMTDMTQIMTIDEIKTLTVAEINKRIRDAFTYDDYKFQLESKLVIDEPYRAENLHKPLYICPHCHKEDQMTSSGTKIWCQHCGASYTMNVYGQLSNKNETKFSHIPDWFEWQRKMVRQDIETDRYYVELDVNVDLLHNSDGYYRIGKGKFIHDKNGFRLEVGNLVVEKGVQESFGVHIEYDYFGRGDGFSFSKNHDTFYIYPIDKNFNVTKLHFATEELYAIATQV